MTGVSRLAPCPGDAPFPGVFRKRYNPGMRFRIPWRQSAVAVGLLLVLWACWTAVSLLFLPSVKPLRNPRHSMVITVKDWNRKDHPFVVGPQNRYWTPLSRIPSSLRKAVVAAEDANFYAHEGVDYEAIKEAIRADLEKGRFVRGGSTITQQLAKNLYLSREKTLSRKAKEYILAKRIDDVLTKGRILELYLNVAELGPMVYGVGHASRFYFGKDPPALTLRESAFLAAMLPGPKVYDPYRNLSRVLNRSDRILKRMFAAGMIPEEEFRLAKTETPNLAGLERKVETLLGSPSPDEEEEPPPAEDAPAESGEPGQEPGGGEAGEGETASPAPDLPEEAVPPSGDAGSGSEGTSPPPQAGR